MMSRLDVLLPLLAHEKGVDLDPAWNTATAPPDGDEGSLALFIEQLGWPAPVRLTDRPRAEHFPLLVHIPGRGWALAEQWENYADVRVRYAVGSGTAPAEGCSFFDVQFPDPVRASSTPRAIDVFWKAILRRKGVIVTATLATVVTNVVTLATSLYSMQVYDRVIPLAGYSTLWVLTVGVLAALMIDFALRTTRALMIEREAASIDLEVSEFFFARAQGVRLDARPPGVGTMAAQLRGMEQVRGLMSSGSLFLVADLPFALFFIVVIFGIGGPIAWVPLISFPLSLALAMLFARLIRTDTDRAQVSGNRKNGLLVESLDAAETIKANRGGWHMLGRWNRLVEEVHHHEDPVKRTSSVAASIFMTLQQVAYVGIVAYGAVLVADGRLTMGGLLACTIIAGRVNGPLVAQLPQMIVQWGYARSSLKALDAILTLPLDQVGEATLRPESLGGPLKLSQVRFAYPGLKEGIEAPSLEFRPGERVAIIGGVGSGKSTLLRLAAGLFAPSEGRITIGGLDLAQIASDVSRRHIGYLPQDFKLVNGTLRENLLLGLSNPGDERILEVAAQTGLAQVIATHPRGLDLPIAEGGRGLSGGQRTLTGITRLLLAKPTILLLDEPTAALDQNTEAKVLKTVVDQLDPEDTFVMVTHKLPLLSMVHRVIVMVGGKVVLDGPTSDVIRRLRPTEAASSNLAEQTKAGAA